MLKNNESILQDFLLSKELQGCSDATLEDYEFVIRKMLEGINKEVTEITPTDLRSYLSSLTVCKVSLSSYQKNLKVFFGWLVKEETITKNPFDNIPMPKVPSTFPKILTEDEINRLIKVAKKSKRDLAILLTLIDTGVRASECCQIELEDLDLAGRSILIRKGKGNKSRYVFFSDLTARALNRYISSRPESFDNALFLSITRKTKIDRATLRQIIKRLGDKAGITSQCSSHVLRHSCATLYIRGGGDIHSLQLLLGHTTPTMTMKYVHIVSADLKQSHAKFSPVKNLFN